MANELIKQYDKQPSEKQRDAMSRAFRNMELYHLIAGDTVILKTTDYYGDSSLLASLLVNGQVISSRKVGMNGGLIVLGNN